MNELKIFDHEYFGKVRVITFEDKEYFVASDIAKALGYAIPSKAVNTHCKGVSKMEVPTNGGSQEMIAITEGDVYRLIMKSKLPSAEKFEKWVMEEVLPSIRKHGAYMTKDTVKQALNNPDFMIQMLQTLKSEQEQHEKTKNILQETKVKLNEVHEEIEQFIDTENVLTMDSVSLNLGIGKNRLYKWLRDNKILKTCEYEYNGKKYKTEEHNTPYYNYTKYFTIKYRMYNTQRYPVLCMTSKGQIWLYKILLNKNVIKNSKVMDDVYIWE